MPHKLGSQSAEGTVIKFQSDESVRDAGRVLVASGVQSRNRDFWSGKPYRLVPGGMRLEKWEKNPLIFYMHHFGIPLAKATLFIEDGKLWAWDEFEFHRKEVPVFSVFGGFGMFDTATIADLWEEGFLNAVSIHIILSRLDEQNVVESDDEIVIPTSEVIETSIVTVPGDPDAVREESEFLEEFVDRLRVKGVSQEMAECVACSYGNVWTPNTPVWHQNEQAANRGSLIQSISVGEVNMNKTEAEETVLETAEAADTPVEAGETVIEATLEESVLEIEQEIELPVADIAQAIAEDPEAILTIANALVNVPGFAESMFSAAGAQTQNIESIVQEVVPQRITVKLVGSNGQSRTEQAQPVQPVQRPAAVQQAVAPVALPNGQADGAPKRRKPRALDLVRPSRVG